MEQQDLITLVQGLQKLLLAIAPIMLNISDLFQRNERLSQPYWELNLLFQEGSSGGFDLKRYKLYKHRKFITFFQNWSNQCKAKYKRLLLGSLLPKLLLEPVYFYVCFLNA